LQGPESSGTGSSRKFWFFTLTFLVMLLILGGAILWCPGVNALDFSWDNITGRLAAQPPSRFFSGGGSCCGAGGSSGGCGGKTSGPVDAQMEKKATTAGLEAYKKINGDTKGLAGKVTDYGCHTQVDIIKGGQILKSYSYVDGQVSEN
jgi:hypothetical protein